MDNFGRALDAHRRGEIDRADGLYRRILSKSPRHAGALTQLALIEQARGSIGQARKLLEKAASVEPDNPSVRNGLGQVLLAQDQPEAAVEEFRAATSSEPNYGPAWHNLGLVQAMRGDFGAAVESFRKALPSSPGDAKLLLNLGHALGETGAFDDAVEVLLSAVRLQPAVPQIRLALGDVLMHAGDATKAIYQYREVERLVPGNPAGPHRLGVAMQQIGDLEAAIAALKRARVLAPESASIACDMANLYAMCGDNLQAQKLFAEIADAADQPAVVGVAARGLAAVGDAAAARKALAPFLQAEQVVPDVALAMADVASDAKNLDTAKSHLEHAIQNTVPSQQATILFSLAETEHRRGAFDRAFGYASDANRMRNARFDAEREAALVDRILAAADDRTVAMRKDKSSDEPRLIFAVGMQRSGLRLLESLLVMQPETAGLGPAGAMQATVNSIGSSGFAYLDDWSDLDADALASVAASHLERVRGRTGAATVIEAVPGNLFHVGIIRRLFPDAGFILCQRTAADRCLSCFFQDFAGATPYAYDLAALGYHSRSVDRLGEFWQSLLGEMMVSVEFETLISEPDAAVDATLKALELPSPETPVTQIDSRRVSWLKRHTDYLHHLGPLMAVLGLEAPISAA